MGNYRTGIESRNKLYQSAKKVFFRKGYSAASVRDIVAEADSQLGLFTYYFKSKSDLAAEILQEFVNNVRSAIDRVQPSLAMDDYMLRFTVYYRCFYNCVSASSNIEAFYSEVSMLPAFDDVNFELRKQYINELIEYCRQFIHNPDIDREYFNTILTSLTIGFEKSFYKDVTEGKIPISFDDAIDIFFKFMYTQIIYQRDIVFNRITQARQIVDSLDFKVNDNFDVVITEKTI